MKIGIISDTHRRVGRAWRAIEMLVREGAQAFIHAGDIVEEENLELLEETGLPYRAVFGNNDTALLHLEGRYDVHKEPYRFEMGGCTFRLMHYPFWLGHPHEDVIIYGHTHERHISYKHPHLFLNPGEACARNKNESEAMMLEIHEDRFIVTAYSRTIKTDIWKSERKEFMR
ncbi:MAG: YfcE family phosphodiesterase [Campylobacterales bacterium]